MMEIQAWWLVMGAPWMAALLMVSYAAPMGCVLLWRRMSYAVDSLAHASMAGWVCIAGYGWPWWLGVSVVGGSLWLVGWLADRQGIFSRGTVMACFSYGALALALILIALLPNASQQLIHRIIFGDILMAGWQGMWPMVALAVGVIAWLAWVWPRMVEVSLSSDWLFSYRWRHQVEAMHAAITTMVVMVVIEWSGFLLASVFFMVPAHMGRLLARHPLSMMVLSAISGAVAVTLGVCVSWLCNWPTGPSMGLLMVVLWCVIWVMYPRGRDSFQ
jgi:zinc transport system permease protein